MFSFSVLVFLWLFVAAFFVAAGWTPGGWPMSRLPGAFFK